jgi:hypothetical protein
MAVESRPATVGEAGRCRVGTAGPGFGGAFISLGLSKWNAKHTMGVRVGSKLGAISPPGRPHLP